MISFKTTDNSHSYVKKPIDVISQATNVWQGTQIMTKNFILNDKALRLRSETDLNHALVFDSLVDGPQLFGSTGASIGTVQHKDQLLITNQAIICKSRIQSNHLAIVGSDLINKTYLDRRFQCGQFRPLTSTTFTTPVQFPITYSSPPIVCLSVLYAGVGYSSSTATLFEVTSSGFSYFFQLGGNGPTVFDQQYVSVNWIAIGN